MNYTLLSVCRLSICLSLSLSLSLSLALSLSLSRVKVSLPLPLSVFLHSLALVFLRCCPPALTLQGRHGSFELLLARALTRTTSQQEWHPEDWDLATPFCLWTGVNCEVIEVDGSSFFSGKQKRSVVRSITLRNVCEFVPEESTCEIPAAIGLLQYVESLYLAGNGFNGYIPDEIGNLKSLKHLFLNSNQ